jgi:glycerophosphoryl diester phosphodiesterase
MAARRALEFLGHRGARGLAPENTLAGFARGLAVGVSGFELDCAVTRDGVVVIYHDAVLNPDITRGPDGKWLETTGPAIWTLTYEELQRYDVGRIKPKSGYEQRFPGQKPVDGTRIPRLADLFALARKPGNERLRFCLEIKSSPLAPERTTDPANFARKVIEVVHDHGMSARVSVLSFDWSTLAAAKEIAPEIPITCLTAEQSWQDNIISRHRASSWTAPLHVYQFGGSIPRTVKAAGAANWAPYYEELTREKVEEAHALGLRVVTWTANEPADLRRMIECGVDGIITDYPDRLRTVAGEMGIPLPHPVPATR